MKNSKEKWSVQWIQVFLEIKLLFGKLKRLQALGLWPTSSQRSCRTFMVSSGEGIQGQTQNSRWMTQWESLYFFFFLSENYTLRECKRERRGKGCTQRELPALGSWVSIFHWQLLTKGWNIHYLGWRFLGIRILCFFFLICSGVSYIGIHHLGPASFDPTSCGGLPGQASDFPKNWS